MSLNGVMSSYNLCLLPIALLEMESSQEYYAEVWAHQKKAFAKMVDSVHQARRHPLPHAVASLCGTQVLCVLAICPVEDLSVKAPPLLQSMAMTYHEHEQVIVTLQVWEDEEVVQWVIHLWTVLKSLAVARPLLDGIRPTCLLARALL